MIKWYSIKNKANDSAEISIYGEIGENVWGDGIVAKEFIKELKALDVNNIGLFVNSPGGSIFEGLAIYNSLKAHKAHITVNIDGLAASIASVIAMSGDKIVMPENAIMMIHNPWAQVGGGADEMKKMADTLDKLKLSAISIYASKTGKNDKEISDMMDSETWFTAQEAVENGFADEVLEPSNAKMSLMQNFNYRNVPKEFLNVTKPKKEIVSMDINELKAKHPDIYEAVMSEGKKEIEAKNVSIETEHAENVASAVTAEMNRIKDVEAQVLVGHEYLINELKFDGRTTGAEAAVAVLQAEKGLRANMAKSLEIDAPEAINVVAEQVNTVSMTEGKEKWEAEYEKNADLQGEFKEVGTYLAYKQGMASGIVKMFNNKGEK